MQRFQRYIVGLIGLLAVGSAWADDPFSFTIMVEEADGTMYNPVMASGSNAEEMFDLLDPTNLRALVEAGNPGQSFDEDERIIGVLDFRGVDINLGFPQANGNEQLQFTVDFDGNGEIGDGESVTFSAAEIGVQSCAENDRRDCIDRLKDYIFQNEGDIISRLYGNLAANSSSDPIAGNPGSMQSQAAQRDFNQGFSQRVSQVWGCGTSAKNEMIMLAKAGFACQQQVADLGFRMPTIQVAQASGTATDVPSDSLYEDYFDRIKRRRGANKATIGLQYAMISASDGDTDIDSTAISLPLSYTVVFNDDPKRKLIFRVPLGMTQTEDADTIHVAFSVAYSHPMNERWSLTPSVGYSVVGSEDLAAASALSSFSLTSSYALNLGAWSMNIGNMIGSYSTQKFKVGDYESDPGISNTVITNGVMFSGPNALLANDLVMEYFINDTRYSGDDLFTDNAQEIGINLGRISTQGEIITSYLKAGLSYMMASGDNDNEADMLRLSLAYKF